MSDSFILQTLGKPELIQIVLKQQKEHDALKQQVEIFVKKNFQGGAKADREDYSQMVSCKDIWDLREAIRKKDDE
ncbi:hypothetical protein [Bacillus atrophaeus]|uniref:hypothetical protein n=1 Tax=Bacillus atrophaeus TaxID=1452 RepID=UPI002E1A19B1|nr:hypothetical protein [Bacillus atrophaeus]